QDLTVENRVSRTQFQYSLEDPDEAELRAWAPKFVARLRELPELHDVATDQLDQGLQARVQIDRATASRLGITPQTIDDALYNAFGQRQISTVFTQLNQYRVVLEVLPEFRVDPSVLDRVYLRSAAGGQVPLSTLASIEQHAAALAVCHQARFPPVPAPFRVAPSGSRRPAEPSIDGSTADT